MSRPFVPLLAAALLAASATTASAAPYASTYADTIGATTFTNAAAGQAFSVTLVFDNGGSSTASQTWEASDLTCVIWTVNNAVYAQDLTATPVSSQMGSLSTDVNGAMWGVFSTLVGNSVPPAAYSSSGFAPAPGTVTWSITGINSLFMSNAGPYVDGAAPGNLTAAGNWSSPAPFAGGCAAPPPGPSQSSVASVPVMGPAGLALMGSALGAAGMFLRRRRKGA